MIINESEMSNHNLLELDRVGAKKVIYADWSGFFIDYTYSNNYKATCIVHANSESEAINKIKTAVRKGELSGDNPRNFKVTGKMKSYNEYSKKFPNSNFDIVM